jgi:hypothetical protein
LQVYKNIEPWIRNNFLGYISTAKRDLIHLSIIMLVALVTRLLAVPFIPEGLLPDSHSYQKIASEISAGVFISSDDTMPLYPIFVALFGGTKQAHVYIGVIFGIISVVLVWAYARTLFEDRKVGMVAAWMMSIYPMAIFYGAVGLTESVFVPLILWAFLALHKDKVVWASILFVLSILDRPTMDIFAPIVILWNALFIREKGSFLAFRDLMIYGVVYVFIMSPWWYHNFKKYDQFVRLNQAFGLVFYAGNNPLNKSGGGINGIDYDLKNVEGFHDSALATEKERLLRDAVIKYIRQEPKKFFEMALVKFSRFWRFIPYTPLVKQSSLALITTMSLLPIIFFAFATLITRHEMFKYFTPILGFIVYLTMIHMITLASIRYRYPLEPLLILIAAPSIIVAWNFILGKIMPSVLPRKNT